MARLGARGCLLGAVTGLSLVLALLLASCADDTSGSGDPEAAGPPPPPSLTMEYAPGLTADVYLPRSPGPAPLVVLVPGGSWMTADPTGLIGLAAALADDGIVAVPTRIRASTDGAVYPEPVEDVLCAVAAAAAQAGDRGFDVGPVVVFGHSSGAHLAALAVLAADDYAPTCDAATVTPDALVGVAGPYDISQVPDMAGALMDSSPDDDPDAWGEANPVERADLRPDVPVLLVHGDADAVVPVDFTTQFAEALEDAGHPTTVEIVDGADHLSIFEAEVAGEIVGEWVLSLPGQD